MISSSSHELSELTYRLLTDFIYKNSGLRFDDSFRTIFRRRISQRLEALQLDTFEKYYSYLRYHPGRDAELENIFDLLTTNETYFFREERQLKCFSEDAIPEIVEERKQARFLRIWSAGCSSGEEPYSIAILCKHSSLLDGWNIDIYASDISQKVIQFARKAVYGESSFRNTPAEIRDRYFERTEEGKYRIHRDIKNMVTFGKLNLLDENRIGIFGEVDVIFCRNVLIYFDTEAKKRVIRNFYNKLRKNGFLLLGHAESLLTLSTQFRLRHMTHDMVYQK